MSAPPVHAIVLDEATADALSALGVALEARMWEHGHANVRYAPRWLVELRYALDAIGLVDDADLVRCTRLNGAAVLEGVYALGGHHALWDLAAATRAECWGR